MLFTSMLHYLRGYLKIRVTGYSPERFLNLCKNKKINIWGLEAKHNAYDMYISISGFRKLKPILKKTQTKVTIEGRFGMPFFFHKYRKRKLFFIGIFLCILFVYSFTFFIWDIDLQGNQSITDEVLLEFLDSKNISHGVVKSKIDCEEITKEIRKNFDDIVWVSASLQGTRLFIQVKENEDTFDSKEGSNEPSDIIADKAGIVRKIVTRNGVPQVTVGDEIQIGDPLVLGTVDVLNDANEVVSHHYVKADADIVIERTVDLEYKINKKYELKEYTNKKRKIFYVKFGENAFFLGRQKNHFENKEMKTSETDVKLDENFYLPICFGSKTILEYKLIPSEYSAKEMEMLLHEYYERVCIELEENNTLILEKNYEIIKENDGHKILIHLTLLEEAGINRKIVDFQSPTVVE